MEQHEAGPYLQSAFFCERLLQEADGVFSAIRIVDTITAEVPEQSSQTEMPRVAVNLTMFIVLKAGQARGNYELMVTMEPPSEISSTHPSEGYTQLIVFEGEEDRGNTIIMPIAMNVNQEGIYWFSVYLNERLITRVPLRVDYQGQIQKANFQ